MTDFYEGWYPVARSSELRASENIATAWVDGNELALWRAADGTAQAWENRCPHRGVRLSLGQVLGDRLSCAYHGWQWQSGTGRCVGVPACPKLPMPPVTVRSYWTHEASGLIWVALKQRPNVSTMLADAVDARWHFFRSLPIAAGAKIAVEKMQHAGFARDGGAWQGHLDDTLALALLLDSQPNLSIIHLWIDAPANAEKLHRVHIEARRLRARIELA